MRADDNTTIGRRRYIPFENKDGRRSRSDQIGCRQKTAAAEAEARRPGAADGRLSESGRSTRAPLCSVRINNRRAVSVRGGGGGGGGGHVVVESNRVETAFERDSEGSDCDADRIGY